MPLNKNLNSENPLVSIVVITYNSSKYVLETLESAKSQTYQNIELIISDDCSTDNTVAVCEKWIEENRNIIRATLITAPINLGISANFNSGLKAANGIWIKFIAGDDILDITCIENYIEKTQSSNCKLFFSNVYVLKDNNISKPVTPEFLTNFFKMNRQEKLQEFSRHAYFLNIPSIFIHRNTLISLGGFNEKYKYLEDIPVIINFLKNNEDIGFSEEYTVYRREHNESVSTMTTSVNNFRKVFLFNLYQAYIDLRRPNYKWYNLKDIYYRIMNDMNFAVYKKPGFLVILMHDMIVKLSKIKKQVLS